MSRRFTYYGSKQSYRFLLDEVPNAIRAHSVFKLSSSYMGDCMRIVTTNQDVPFVNNLIDANNIIGSDANILTWYDQTLNADAVAVGGRRPIIKTSGNVRTLNSKPALFFNHSTTGVNGQTQTYLVGGSNIFRNTGHGVVAMVLNSDSNLTNERSPFQTKTSTFTRALISYRNAAAGNQGLATGGRRLAADSFQGVGTSSFSSSQIIVVAYFNWANAELTIWENNVITGTRVFQTAGLTENNAGEWWLGSSEAVGNYLNGHIQECVIWQGADAQNAAANVSTIFDNINSRYNTY